MDMLNIKEADKELWQLRNEKTKLEMILKIKAELAARPPEIHQPKRIVHPEPKSNEKKDTADLIRNRLATEHLQNFKFEDVTCTLLQENDFLCKGKVQAGLFSFDLELKVAIKGETDFEILSIDAKLPTMEKCYLLEIEPWFNGLTSTTAFHLFMKNVSLYKSMYALRESILNEFAVFEESSVLYETCDEDTGGMFITFHAPQKKKQVYATLLWYLCYDRDSLKIEHNIMITTLNNEEFKKKHKRMLKKLCEPKIEDWKMKELWIEFRNAIHVN